MLICNYLNYIKKQAIPIKGKQPRWGSVTYIRHFLDNSISSYYFKLIKMENLFQHYFLSIVSFFKQMILINLVYGGE